MTLFKHIQLFLGMTVGSIVLMHCLGTAQAQSPVNGNGKIVEQIRPLGNFSAVLIDFSADVTIVNGETPSFVITADENVLPHIGTKVRGGKLHITQDKWIEPSQSVMIRVGTPFTASLETSGYSDVIVEGIDGPRLKINAGVGTVSLHGKAERLQVRTKTGNIDASNLNTPYADVAISSHGKVKLGVISNLKTDVNDNGTVVYDGSPDINNRNDQAQIVSVSEYVNPEDIEVQYIEFVLVNNSRQKLSLRVEGPRERPFGYGFDLKGNAKRKETWPIGTKLYAEGKLLSDKLLVTISEDMVGQEVDLFERD